MGTPVQPTDDAFEQAMRRKKLQEGIAQGIGGQPAPSATPSPAPSPTPTPQPQSSPLDRGKLKLSMGMPESSLTPEEKAALAAEQINAQPAASPAGSPGPAEPGFLQRMMSAMSAIGLGG